MVINMKAIVLSGGGAKGSYQIGFWKAIRKLNIDFDVITGTSVGALNGALMIQDSYKDALKLWKNISYKGILKDDIDVEEIKKTYVKYALKGGIEPTNLHEMMEDIIDEEKIRNSNINYGLVTVKFPSMKKMELEKKDIPKGKFAEYLMASSACFPFFEAKEINGTSYIDGGYYDNLPINLAIKLGATEIIAVDLEAIGFKRSVKNKVVDIKYISPKSDIGGILEFESDIAIRNIRYGYNDTMKAFDKLDGNKYSFRKNSLEKNYKKYKNKFINVIKENLSNADKSIKSILSISVIKNILDDDDKEIHNLLNEIVEKIGQKYNIDDSYIYRIGKFNRIMLKKFLDSNDKLNKLCEKIENNNSDIYDFMILDIDEYLMAVYLYILKKRKFML